MKILLNFLLYAVVPAILFTVSGPASSAERITIGEIENVVLMPWGIALEARIDTLAPTTSLEVRDLRVRDNMVEFRLPMRYGGLKLQLPLIGWLWSRAADDLCQLRPAVELELGLGSKRLQTQVTLNDHSSMEYPMTIGWGTLEKGTFLIDVSRSYTLSPNRLKEILP